jgi:FAD/FMN-containing dehydrogenase
MNATRTDQFVFPDDVRWDDARRAWNLAVDQRPSVVALPASVDDVIAAVAYARERDLEIAIQGTGHGASPGSLAGTLLINMRNLRGVEIDVDARRARVEAGAWWEDVAGPANAAGLTALHGSSPNVGVVGYTLGGGIGWLSRKHGLSSESVLAVELVTADGALLRADSMQNTDLFWALRGGGGGLGVVVAVEIALYRVEELVAGMLVWPWEQAPEVLGRYVEWAESAPDEVTVSARLLQIPPLPDIPDAFRGRRLVVIDGAVLGTEHDAGEILAPLRALEPELDTFGAVDPSALLHLHMDPEGPMPGLGGAMSLGALDADAVAALLEVAGPGTDSPLVSVELRQLGGALRRRVPGAGAQGALEGSFAFLAVGAPVGPGVGEAIMARVDALKAVLARWDSGATFVNFADTRKTLADAIGEHGVARLQVIKEQIDPDGMFRLGRSLAVTGPGDAAVAA